jgi:hypothetical protein
MDYFYQQKLINEKNQLQRQLMEANHELNQLKAIVQEMTEILGAEPLKEGKRRVGKLRLDLDDPVVKPEKPLSRSQKNLDLDLDDPAGAVDMAQRGQLPKAATKRPLGTRPVTEDIQTPERAAETASVVRRLGREATRLGKRSDAIYKKIYGVDVDKVNTVGDLGRIGFGGVDPYDTSYPDSVDAYVDAVAAKDQAEARAERERKHPTKIYGLGGKIVGTKAKKKRLKEDLQTPERAAEMETEIKDWTKYVNRLGRRSNALWNAMYGKKATVSPATEPMEFADSVDDLIDARTALNDAIKQNQREKRSKTLYGKGGKVMRTPRKK